MNPDDFERLLAEALDPGELAFPAEQKASLRAVLAAASSAAPCPWEITAMAAGEMEAPASLDDGVRGEMEAEADFIGRLTRGLDPGDIELDPDQRRDLIRQMTGGLRAEDLTAWAVGELPDEPGRFLERRMANDVPFREEVLEIRRFCGRLERALPAVPQPGWLERWHLRRLFAESAPSRRPLWIAAAAAVALLAAIAPWGNPPSAPAEVVQSVKSPPAEIFVPIIAEAGPPPALPPVAGPERRLIGELAEPVIAPWAEEPAFAFTPPPSAPSVLESGIDVPPPSVPEILADPVLVAGRPEPPVALATNPSRFDHGPVLAMAGEGFADGLLADAGQLQRFGLADTDETTPDLGAAPLAMPDLGSLSLANSQPYILPALLGGPVSGRPENLTTGGQPSLSAEFRSLDLSVPSGGSVDADSWTAAAGMTWQLAPSWQASLSIAGIDSRLDVPGFGTVDVEGASLAWSLDWRHEGFHVALAHEIGSFDQDLLRRTPTMIYPVGQDATVQRLSLWMTREFETGDWNHGPVAGLDGAWGSLDAYQEPFAGGVTMGGRDFESLTALAGWQAWGSLESPVGRWLPHAVAGWRHRPVVPDAAIVQGTAAGNFVVSPAVSGRDSLLLEGGVRWLPGDGNVFLDLISSGEWRDGGESDKSVLIKLGIDF